MHLLLKYYHQRTCLICSTCELTEIYDTLKFSEKSAKNNTINYTQSILNGMFHMIPYPIAYVQCVFVKMAIHILIEVREVIYPGH